MPEKCVLLKKQKNGKVYHKCESHECGNQCVLYFDWKWIKRKGLDGKEYDWFYVLDAGCECIAERDLPWGGTPPNDPHSCLTDVTYPREMEKDGRKFNRSFVRCVKQGCPDECVFYMKFSDPEREYGEFIEFGCECVNWGTL
jgi:hypothetical protein